MTNETDMPKEIWARNFDAPQYRVLFFKYAPCDERTIKYIHHTEHQKALDALEVAREAIDESSNAIGHAALEIMGVASWLDLKQDHWLKTEFLRLTEALTQINEILGGE